MESHPAKTELLAKLSKRFVRRLLAIAENRVALLSVEVQEERERFLHVVLMAIGLAVFGFLAGITLTGLIVALLWTYSPWATFLALTLLYGGAALGFYFRLKRLFAEWRHIPATMDQLRKDRACLEKQLS